MKLNPFHPDFGVTRKTRITAPHIVQLLAKNGADYMVGIAQFPTQHSELHHLCQKHGTDKGHTDLATHPCGGLAGKSYTHNYASVYDLLFAQKRKHIKNILECGIGANNPETGGSMTWASDAYKPGASLRMWQEYFPNAQIVGLDHDPTCLFTDERIETYQCDQTDPKSIANFLAQIGERKFDIVIDDGLHKYHAGITLFENVIDRLTDDGIYVIEDIRQNDVWRYSEYFKNTDYATRFCVMWKAARFSGDVLLVITKKK